MILKDLTDIARLWIRRTVSHPFRLSGLKLHNDIMETIDAICFMREMRDHPLLGELQYIFEKAIEEYEELPRDISLASVWIEEVTNILLGEKDETGKRQTEAYKEKMTRQKVERKLLSFVTNLAKQKKTYSPFLQSIIYHFRLTLNNWKKYLFTCYDTKVLPNTNLELEVSHSRLKQKHRRMTGKKNSNQFLILHGEQASFCFELDYPEEELRRILSGVDFEEANDRRKQEKRKSQKRGEHMRATRNVSEKLEKLREEWAETHSMI